MLRHIQKVGSSLSSACFYHTCASCSDRAFNNHTYPSLSSLAACTFQNGFKHYAVSYISDILLWHLFLTLDPCGKSSASSFDHHHHHSIIVKLRLNVLCLLYSFLISSHPCLSGKVLLTLSYFFFFTWKRILILILVNNHPSAVYWPIMRCVQLFFLEPESLAYYGAQGQK